MLFRRGFTDVLDAIGVSRSWVTPLTAESRENLSVWERLRLTLEDLGPTYVKFGQVISARPDLLPEPLVREFRKLRTEVRPVPYELIEPVLLAELGAPLTSLFSEFNQTPVASGSIGQVYQARLRENNQWVAVKVQRPGIRKAIRADIEILGWMARRLSEALPELASYDAPGIVAALGEGIMQELDFSVEACNATLFNHLNPYEDKVFAPYVYEAYTTERLTICEWINGRHPGDPAIAAPLRKELAIAGGRSMFHQIVVSGFFHADPHSGNFMVTTDGRGCLLDWGLAGQLTREMRYNLADLFSAVASNDPEKVARVATRMAETKTRIDTNRLEKSISLIMRRYALKIEEGEDLGEIVIDLIYVFGGHGIQLASDYALLAKAVVATEEVGKSLNPEFDIRSVATPYLKRLNYERWNPRNLAKTFLWSTVNNLARLRELPQDIQRFLRHLEDGEIKINMRHEGIDEAAEEFSSGVNRLTLSMITAALLVGSSIIMASTVDKDTSLSELFRLPAAIGTVGFLLSALFGVWTVVDIVRHGRHRQ